MVDLECIILSHSMIYICFCSLWNPPTTSLLRLKLLRGLYYMAEQAEGYKRTHT
jgi:hypothetical protein